MGKMKQLYIAQTMGSSFTMYAAMKAMGIPLSEEQARFQEYIEETCPPVVGIEEVEKEDKGESDGMES
ncbi:MAG: hypothetical protein ACWGQW_00510 [bacterium]